MSETQNIGSSLAGFSAALEQSGSSFEEFVRDQYVEKWMGDTIYHVMRIRTSLVAAALNYLAEKGLLNLERVSMSPVTDPLAHDIEHSPTIDYKGHRYKTTHSMIYSKFLACFNPRVRGVFVDSPNIRLELESADGTQRGKYLADFSQIDVELRRDNAPDLESYLNQPEETVARLRGDMDEALAFFEGLVVSALSAVVANNAEDLAALGVVVEVPATPFPRVSKDDAVAMTGTRAFEKALGEKVGTPFFWVTGLMRENYDLIYPYLKSDGTRRSLDDFTSEEIYNFDLCAQSRWVGGGSGGAYEVMSGAIREWLPEPIIERLIDNRILKVRPELHRGKIVNFEELAGYGPFLAAVGMRDDAGKPLFPATFGAGIGVERLLFAILKGPKVAQVDDVTLFGKNPDSPWAAGRGVTITCV